MIADGLRHENELRLGGPGSFLRRFVIGAAEAQVRRYPNQLGKPKRKQVRSVQGEPT
jgi:hypothetical protein